VVGLIIITTGTMESRGERRRYRNTGTEKIVF